VLLLEAGPDLRAHLPDEIRDGWHMTRQFDWGDASDPDELGITPGYEQREIEADLNSGALVPVASGRPGHSSAIRIRNAYAALHVARLAGGQSVTLPDSPFGHVFVASGAVDLEGAGSLDVGDAARLSGAGARRLTATEPGEILVWEMHATLRN
jgi:redox-sensitive bicupin YhaK (pirin superfamily)